MTWPSAATKTHLDQASDDPKQARSELADLVDKFNDIQAHVTSYMQGLLNDADAATARITLGLVIGTNVQADLDVPSDAEVDAGVATTERVWTAAKVKRAVDQHAGSGAIPAGGVTFMLFYQSSVPTGWTRMTTAAVENHAMRLITTTGMNTGTKGGANTFTAAFDANINTGTHVGTTPAHTHSNSGNCYENFGNSSGTNQAGDSGSTARGNNSTNSGGAGGSHAHTFQNDVKYVDISICSYN